jgi:DNA-binding MarR family transcriptional regulator
VATKQSIAEEAQTLGALLRGPFEAMLHYNFGHLAEEGFSDIRIAHGAVFRNMSREGSRLTELAERARMTKQSMADLVDYLRERGYLKLYPDPNDGRAKLIQLTERGMNVVNALIRISRRYERECASVIGEEKWAQFRSLLTQVGEATREVAARRDLAERKTAAAMQPRRMPKQRIFAKRALQASR